MISAILSKIRDYFKPELPSTPEEYRRAQLREREPFFTEGKRSAESPRVEVSPSGTYRLVISKYDTKPGCWGYTRGEVYLVAENRKIGDVKRNYSSFPFLWMEGHVDGHDYLIAGEDYQGQTFIQLDTATEKVVFSGGAQEGYGFCWASYRLLDDRRTLLVSGCHWACPYEYMLFDVSNPMEEGWPALTTNYSFHDFLSSGDDLKEGTETLRLDDMPNAVLRTEDGMIIWEEGDYIFRATGISEASYSKRSWDLYLQIEKAKHQGNLELAAELSPEHERINSMSEGYECPEEWEFVPYARIVLERNETGTGTTLREAWLSDARRESLRNSEEAREAAEERRQAWIDADSFVAVLREKVPDWPIGVQYPSTQDRVILEKPNPAFFRVSLEEGNRTSTLSWGVQEGPIVLDRWVRGVGSTKEEFPRTREGLESAYEAARAHTKSSGEN